MKLSATKWEESYFGGYTKVLYDYPEVKVPLDVDWDTPKDSGLGYYNEAKLIKIFLLKVNELNFGNALMVGAVIKPLNTYHGVKDFLVSNKEQVSLVLDGVIHVDEELSNLFLHYEKIIRNTIFKMEIPEESKGSGKGSGGGKKEDEKGDGDDGEGSETEDQKGGKPTSSDIISKMIKDFVDMIGEIQVRKSAWEDYTGALSGDLKKCTKFKLMKPGNTRTNYTSQEELYAKRLIDTLDISFEPEVDKVNNLKLGKIDTNKLAQTLAGNFHIYYNIQENQITKPFSVCILGDESGSMGHVSYPGSRAHYQRSIMKILYRTFSQIMPPDKIFVYGHSGSSTPEIRIYNDKYNHIFEYAIDKMELNSFSENYDGPVIECVYEKVRSFTDDNIIFISISDGQPCGANYGGIEAVNDLKRVIEKCKRDGFVTLGIGVQFGAIREIYSYNTVVEDMSNMVKQVSTLVNQVVKTEFQS